MFMIEPLKDHILVLLLNEIQRFVTYTPICQDRVRTNSCHIKALNNVAILLLFIEPR